MANDGVTFKIDAANVLRKLKRLDSKTAKRAYSQIARKALKPVRAETIKRAPVQSGSLKKSIAVRAMRRSRKRFGGRVTTKAGHAFKGPTFYGGFQEWGWKSRGGLKIKGKFFMAKATKATRGKALKIFTEELDRRLLKEWQN